MFLIRPLVLGILLTMSIMGLSQPGSSTSGHFDQNRSCVGLDPPSDGNISTGFAPGANYSGHWGIDYRDDADRYIVAAAAGRVTFSGLVVENLVVTIDHGGGLKTSYSYLDRITVMRGQRIGRGEVIGQAGSRPFHDDVHFSVRIEGVYINPEPLLGCLPRAPSVGLRLVATGTRSPGNAALAKPTEDGGATRNRDQHSSL